MTKGSMLSWADRVGRARAARPLERLPSRLPRNASKSDVAHFLVQLLEDPLACAVFERLTAG